MANEKFYLIFGDAPLQRIRINEPIDFSEVDFNLSQKEGGMGRDVTLSGGVQSFKFTKHRHDVEFRKILYYNDTYGFEADVKLVIVLESGQEFIGELDFATARTNDYDYFDCSVSLESSLQIFKRRSETKVDMFASTTIDGEFIEPLVPINMLLKAKPSIQQSTWETKNEVVIKQYMFGNDRVYFFPLQQSLTFDIKNSYVPFQNSLYFSPTSGSADEDAGLDSYNYITSDSKLKNIKVKIHIGNMKITHSTTSGSFIDLVILYGQKARTQRKFVELETTTAHSLYINNKDYEVEIEGIERGDKIWFNCSVTQTTPISTGGFNGVADISYSGITMSISTESTAYNSITPSFRLIDVMRQIAKSTSNLDVFAPRYENGGQFYDTILTNGNLLRNITDKPFYVSWDDIEKSIKGEHYADSEIQIDERVFVGLYEDYHTNNECGFFDKTQFSGLNKVPNPLYVLNEFNFKYETYQSLKENTEPNSDSTIHGQSIFTLFNKKADNKVEPTIKWVRDSVLLDVQQRLSTLVSKDTATQDDDKIFAIDTIDTTEDQRFAETTNLQHTYAGSILYLRSGGEVNFLVLGIRVGTALIIDIPDANNGNYNVLSVTNTELQLERVSAGSISSANDGARLTKYQYEIKKETIPLTNRTNEGFGLVLNLISPDKYSNLRYSVERNIRNYWNQFLASVNLYHKDKPLRNTFYKNNGQCETEYSGLRIKEKEDWIPNNPIVTPFMYEDVVFANVEFSEFITLQNQIRMRRGFIRTIDNNNRVLKLYPIKMSYENKSRQLTLTGQEKFQQTYLTINNEGGVITINNETMLKTLSYEIEEEYKVLIFDNERQRLYNGVWWNQVSVNGAVPETIEILKGWLDLLK